MFTSQHYKFLASVLHDCYEKAATNYDDPSPEQVVEMVIEAVACELEKRDTNERFDPERFVRMALEGEDVLGPPPNTPRTEN
jgi:hypothetical protein